ANIDMHSVIISTRFMLTLLGSPGLERPDVLSEAQDIIVQAGHALHPEASAESGPTDTSPRTSAPRRGRSRLAVGLEPHDEGSRPMTIRQRTLVLLGSGVAVLVALLWIVMSAVTLRSFTRLEQAETLTDVRRAVRALHESIEELHLKSADWATWDD